MSQKRNIERTIEDIVDDLYDEKCTLFIGPEFLTVNNKPLMQYIHGQVLEDNYADILHYHSRDNLFLFSDEVAKLNAPRLIKRIYRGLEVDTASLEKILELPFSLIIALTPDTFLTDMASGSHYGIPHNFRFFRYNGEGHEELPEPKKDCPLFYNLFGCINEDESLVLDYNDLFQLLQVALGPDGLPRILQKKLMESRSYVFLGFDFEKWYAQLLLQLLIGKRRGAQKLAIDTSIASNESRNFLLHQFRIDFLDDDLNFLDQLHYACSMAPKPLLRRLKKALSLPTNLADEIRTLIIENQLNEAINILERATIATTQYDEVILLKSRFQDWYRNSIKDTMYSHESEVLINRIREELLQIVNQVA